MDRGGSRREGPGCAGGHAAWTEGREGRLGIGVEKKQTKKTKKVGVEKLSELRKRKVGYRL